MVVNQRRQTRNYDTQPLKLGCINHETTKTCSGYLRNVDQRPPLREPPVCERGEGCTSIRWKSGDVIPTSP